jgi:poly(3-hydroxybutyrate) depolymerase
MRCTALPRQIGLLGLLTSLGIGAHAPAQQEAARFRPSEAERAELRRAADAFADSLEALDSGVDPDLHADVRVFGKAVHWLLREDEFYTNDYVAMARESLAAGAARREALASGKAPWRTAKGGSIQAYRSGVDGSLQPFALYIPDSYDGGAASRLDVILHGRDGTLNEVKFVRAHEGKPYPEGETGLILHVFGRGNNAYRWAGEADVFEAIAAVSRRYRVDPRRVVLRGFSMGGAGAWHLGLHHPREWCAVEAGAGFTESRRYARLRDLPDYQERTLHIYDAADYALNAFDVPVAGYGGEEDPQLQASTNVLDALKGLGFMMTEDGLVTRGEGLDFLRVVGAKMGHRVDPASASILKEFRDRHAERGQPERRDAIRFATYTLAYDRAPWLSVQGLTRHYERAEIDAEVRGDVVHVDRSDNVTILAVDRDAGETIAFGDQEFPLRPAVGGLLPEVYFRKSDDGWLPLDYDESRALQLNVRRQKRPGLQGPIDHAFAGPFLCVRGTGQAWNPNVQAWADARLERFAGEWRTFLRGELRIKNDVDVTDEDVERYHLILFGDPGSNRWIERVLPELPIRWSRTELAVGDGPASPAADHAPALIAANPLSPLRYVVLNSGHTFGPEDFRGTNALLYPRLGDWAVLRVLNEGEEVQASGFFDEQWRYPSPQEE